MMKGRQHRILAQRFMLDIGNGPVVVLVPGIQGRWEWMGPAVTALARRCRVLTFSLCGEPGSDCAATGGFERYVEQIDAAIERAHVGQVTICGVSFGGFISLHYAALRRDRVRGLALVSTPSPTWRPNCRLERYLAAPRLMSPLFVAGAPFRLWPEVSAAVPGWGARLRFAFEHTARVVAAPIAPTLMAERMRLARDVPFESDCGLIDVPTLVVTGESDLDRVVPTTSTREYLSLIPSATEATIEDTGHIGLVTRPDAFAKLIADFAERTTIDQAASRMAHA
jgi:pimeloyl-ACP methyl ester carboxylesterase